MDAISYFNSLESIEYFYEPEDVFFEPFYKFSERFHSLQRHWQLNKDFVAQHLVTLNAVTEDGYKKMFDGALVSSSEQYKNMTEDERKENFDPDSIFYEPNGFFHSKDEFSSDQDYFPEYLRLSTISFALSLIENLLGDLSIDIAEELGVSVDLVTRPMPYINKYLLWFTRGCGMELSVDSSINKSLDAIREMRNRFIHKIDRDIPEKIKKVISEMVQSTTDSENPINDDFVDSSLQVLSDLVKVVELSYIDFYEKVNK